jgi:hypothetical protein
MHQHDIPSRLSQAATNKVLWAHSKVNAPEADRYMRLADEAEIAIVGTPARSPDMIIAKLAMAMDWASNGPHRRSVPSYNWRLPTWRAC